MANNVAQFSLGLAAGQFLSTISQATRGVSGLIGAGLRIPVVGTAVGGLVGSIASASSVIENTFGAISKGSELNALHKRTGETVTDLYAMEKGFKAVHLPADNLGNLIFHLQKALGGFNEMGEPTKDIFAGIGLSVDDLKTKRAPEQLEMISAALAKLNKEEAATAAGKIFGRGGAADALQIARSGSAFSDAMRASAESGALFARNAEVFERIELSIGRVKSKFNTVFANLAEGAAPGIQSLLDLLNNIDVSGFARRLGTVVSGITEAIHQGKLAEVIGLSMKAGIQEGSNFMLGKIAEWSDAIRQAFADKNEADRPGFWARVGLNTQGVYNGALGGWDMLGEKLGLASKEQTDFRLGRAQELFLKAGSEEGLLKPALEAFNRGVEGQKNEFLEKLGKLISDLSASARARLENETGKVVGDAISSAGAKAPKRGKDEDTNALERIGLLFFAQNRVDYTQQTAANTAKTNVLLEKLISGTYTDSFGNKHVFANQ